MLYALAAVGGAVACYFVLHFPLKAKVNQVKKIIATELNSMNAAVLSKITKALS